MSRISRRDAIRATAAAGFGAAAGLTMGGPAMGQEKPGRRPPNIIYIMADDLGYGDLGCYGQETIQTPRIDTMAAEGIRFTDCYSGSTVCAPSRCCLMTGFHTGHARVRSNCLVPLAPEDVTVAEVLKQAGYSTGIVGKWGIGEAGTTGVPNRQGFDEWFGYLNQGRAHNYYPEYLWRDERKVPLEGNLDGKQEQYSHDLFTGEGLDFIRRHQNRPFFLYMAYTLPHANNELTQVTGNGMEIPHDRPYTARDWPQQQKNHAAMITLLDDDVGQILDQLKALGLDENTIVFFTSDNGPHREGGAKPEFFNSNGPLRGIKRDLYEGGIRVPMVVRWPGRIDPGATSDVPWAFWDFMPTAAELAGATCPDGIDGVSMAPAVLGRTQTDESKLYWEFEFGKNFGRAVRIDNWKAVRLNDDAPVELYDLNEDIGETENVAAAHPDLVRRAGEMMTAEHTPWPHYRRGY